MKTIYLKNIDYLHFYVYYLLYINRLGVSAPKY